MKRSRLRRKTILTVLFIAGVTLAQSTPILPPVVVTAPRVSGGNVLCRGTACADIIANMQSNPPFVIDHMPPIDEVPVDQTLFCAALQGTKPAGCLASYNPPTPGFGMNNAQYAASHANGCGDGGIATYALAAIGPGVSPVFSGNLDTPFVGTSLSFRNACNEHDTCYASESSRGSCDVAFGTALTGVCGNTFSSGSANHLTCTGFRDVMSGAVIIAGQTAYAAAQTNRACAFWHSDMEANQCPK